MLVLVWPVVGVVHQLVLEAVVLLPEVWFPDSVPAGERVFEPAGAAAVVVLVVELVGVVLAAVLDELWVLAVPPLTLGSTLIVGARLIVGEKLIIAVAMARSRRLPPRSPRPPIPCWWLPLVFWFAVEVVVVVVAT